MRATRGERGFLLGYIMIVAAILSLVAMLLLQSAQSGAVATRSIEVKNNSFNAAEAGLNSALEALDRNIDEATTRTETLADGYKYTYSIYPNFHGSLSQLMNDPGEVLGGKGGSDQVSVPAGGAVIVVEGTGPSGERPTVLEAAVTVDTAMLAYPHYALTSGLNVQGVLADAASSGQPAITVHANGSITARNASSLTIQSEASGKTNTLPTGKTNAPQVTLPMVSQFDYMVASYKNQATTYGTDGDVYLPDGSLLASSYRCPTLPAGESCLLFYDGALTMTSQQTTLNGPWTMIVDGDLSMSGTGALLFAARPSLLIVNGNAKLLKAAQINAYLEVKGSTTLSSAATLTGAILTLGTLTFTDGSGGGIDYDPSVIPPGRAMTGLVKIISYAEF